MIGTDLPYEISRSDGRCAATGRTLEPGDRVVVALGEREGEAVLHRFDFAEDAWAGGARPPTDVRVFASWRHIKAEPKAKKGAALDDGHLLEVFGQLEPSDSAAGEAVRYLIALHLLRRRLVVPTDDAGAGELRVTARGPAARTALGDDAIAVREPSLTPAQLAEASAALLGLLDPDGEG